MSNKDRTILRGSSSTPPTSLPTLLYTHGLDLLRLFPSRILHPPIPLSRCCSTTRHPDLRCGSWTPSLSPGIHGGSHYKSPASSSYGCHTRLLTSFSSSPTLRPCETCLAPMDTAFVSIDSKRSWGRTLRRAILLVSFGPRANNRQGTVHYPEYAKTLNHCCGCRSQVTALKTSMGALGLPSRHHDKTLKKPSAPRSATLVARCSLLVLCCSTA